jgi:sterol desaturase/sphingolipid hydroxylase (fatty acid hydroxylase superfamily)
MMTMMMLNVTLGYYGKLGTTFVIFTTRNYMLLYFVGTILTTKEPITSDAKKKTKEKEEAYWGEFDVHVLSSVGVETITHAVIERMYLFDNTLSFSVCWWWLHFIGVSFLFEVVFDFFHYIGHRALHANPYLYKYIHKKHHTHPHPRAHNHLLSRPARFALVQFVACVAHALHHSQSVLFSV